MIEKLCNKLTKRIQNKMPEIDEERAEVINYGLQLVLGEIPKTFIILLIAYLFGVLKLSILALIFSIKYSLYLLKKMPIGLKVLFGNIVMRICKLLI